jgi:hypothetical protein
MKDMLWIEDIVESTQAPPFLTNLKIGMANFVDPHKVVVKSVFLTFPNASNGVESEGGVESESEFGFGSGVKSSLYFFFV